MERLTDKLVVNNKFAGYCAKSNKQCRVSNRNEVNDITNATEIINKCGKLEDVEEKHNMSIDEMDAYITEHKKIEKEIGIKLTTLFKAIKNGVYTKLPNEKQIVYYMNQEIHLSCDDLFNEYQAIKEVSFVNDELYFRCGNNCFFLADYGKTWALTKEELEK